MEFRGNYTLTFHAQGGVTQVMLPEPPPHCPITTGEALAWPDEIVVGLIKRAICNRAQHHAHGTLILTDQDVIHQHCSSWRTNDAMIQFLIETHPGILLHPDLFPDSKPGTERHGR